MRRIVAAGSKAWKERPPREAAVGLVAFSPLTV